MNKPNALLQIAHDALLKCVSRMSEFGYHETMSGHGELNAIKVAEEIKRFLTDADHAPSEAITDEDICRIYQSTLGQVLREQDRKTVSAFARAIVSDQALNKMKLTKEEK